MGRFSAGGDVGAQKGLILGFGVGAVILFDMKEFKLPVLELN
ncbi:MAG: hypothetical protein PHY73_07700 [Candidatus Omnitrophica bacterium]|nr:hypothetical protein [Candidatus Omnitrophota bacterium]